MNRPNFCMFHQIDISEYSAIRVLIPSYEFNFRVPSSSTFV